MTCLGSVKHGPDEEVNWKSRRKCFRFLGFGQNVTFETQQVKALTWPTTNNQQPHVSHADTNNAFLEMLTMYLAVIRRRFIYHVYVICKGWNMYFVFISGQKTEQHRRGHSRIESCQSSFPNDGIV